MKIAIIILVLSLFHGLGVQASDNMDKIAKYIAKDEDTEKRAYEDAPGRKRREIAKGANVTEILLTHPPEVNGVRYYTIGAKTTVRAIVKIEFTNNGGGFKALKQYRVTIRLSDDRGNEKEFKPIIDVPPRQAKRHRRPKTWLPRFFAIYTGGDVHITIHVTISLLGGKKRQTTDIYQGESFNATLKAKDKTKSEKDPHLQFYVAAIGANVCYNLHGKPNQVVELFTAPDKEVKFNAQFDNSIGPKAKYTDRCALIMPTWNMIVTLNEVTINGTVYSWGRNKIQIDGTEIKLDERKLTMPIVAGSGSLDIMIKRRRKARLVGLDFIFNHQPSETIGGILGKIESQIVSVDTMAGKKTATMTLTDDREIQVKYSTWMKDTCWLMHRKPKGDFLNIGEFTRPCLTCT